MKMKIFSIIVDIVLVLVTGIRSWVHFTRGNNLVATCWTITAVMWVLAMILKIMAFKKRKSDKESEKEE